MLTQGDGGFAGGSSAGTPAYRPTYRLRILEPADLTTVVPMLAEQFPEGFNTRLGVGFLRTYFRQYLRSRGSVGFVATLPDSDAVIGYLIGTVDQRAHDRDMKFRSTPALAWAGAGALLGRPAELSLFVRTRALRYVRRYLRGVIQGLQRSEAQSRTGELLYLHTAPDQRHLGAGSQLLQAFVTEARRSRTTRLTLVTERANITARTFYERRGWTELQATSSADGRPLCRFDLLLNGVPE